MQFNIQLRRSRHNRMKRRKLKGSVSRTRRQRRGVIKRKRRKKKRSNP